jgi:hypothetical protein
VKESLFSLKKIGGDLLLLKKREGGDLNVLKIEGGDLLLLKGGGGREEDLFRVADGAAMWQRNARFYVGVALPCLVVLVLSSLVTPYSGLKKPECGILSIECFYQNLIVL